MQTLNLDVLLKSIMDLLQLSTNILSDTDSDVVDLLEVVLNLLEVVAKAKPQLTFKHRLLLKISADIIKAILPAFNENQEIVTILQQVRESVHIIIKLQE